MRKERAAHGEQRASYQQLEATLAQRNAECAERKAQLDQTVRDWEQKHARAMEEAEGSHRGEVNALIEDHLKETRALSEEFKMAQAMMLDRTQLLESRYAELEERFMSRESRPEDISRIQALEQEVRKCMLKVRVLRCRGSWAI